MKRTVDIDKLLYEMVEVLGQWDGESIERIANQILTTPVKYVGDSTFEIEEPTER